MLQSVIAIKYSVCVFVVVLRPVDSYVCGHSMPRDTNRETIGVKLDTMKYKEKTRKKGKDRCPANSLPLKPV